MRMIAALVSLLVATSVYAAETKEKLRWGADIQSGAPYSYKSPEDPNKVIGFEAEIVDALAVELGMEVQFVQNNWEGLIEGLKRRDYDVVVNGLEITPDRAQEVYFSTPYYLTSEALAVRKVTEGVATLEDLKNKRVGTLEASLAQRILKEQKFPIEAVPYTEEVHAYGDLALGRVDAVLLDEPIALYYAKPNPTLKLVGEPIGKMEYGIALRKGDAEFNFRINTALEKLIRNGTIRTILEKWNLWNPMTAKAWGMDTTPLTKPTAYFKYLETAWAERSFQEKFEKYVSFLPLLARGALMTLEISILSMALAMIIGLIMALCRLYGPSPVAWSAMAFVELVRGTPLLIQLYLIFYGLPHLGIRFDPFFAAVIGLGLNYGACESENYRAGILSIPKSQMDASQALGMSWGQSLRHIILPQAIRVVIPPVTNDFIALLKDSSLVSVISMVELTTTYGQLASTYFDYLGIGLLTAAVYFLIGLPFVRLSRYFELQMNTTVMKSPKSNGWRAPVPGALREIFAKR
ncbi:MAG: ABC transporter permease subunit [Bdellovibrionales bacterium]